MVYKINLRFRRFSCGTGQITGLTAYYIAPRPKDARRGSSVSKLNLEATLNAYENRIKSLPREGLLALENAWLSSYDVWDTIPFDKMEEEIHKRHGTSLDNNAYRLI